MGLYPPGTAGASSEFPEALMSDLGPARPPFHVRDETKISAENGASALPHEFAQVPLMNVEKTNF